MLLKIKNWNPPPPLVIEFKSEFLEDPRGYFQRDITEIVFALNNEKRQAILGALVKHGPLSRDELMQKLGLSKGSLKYHLHTLRSAGIIESRRKKRKILYNISSKGQYLLNSLLDSLR